MSRTPHCGGNQRRRQPRPYWKLLELRMVTICASVVGNRVRCLRFSLEAPLYSPQFDAPARRYTPPMPTVTDPTRSRTNESAVFETRLPLPDRRQGKVRDV